MTNDPAAIKADCEVNLFWNSIPMRYHEKLYEVHNFGRPADGVLDTRRQRHLLLLAFVYVVVRTYLFSLYIFSQHDHKMLPKGIVSFEISFSARSKLSMNYEKTKRRFPHDVW